MQDGKRDTFLSSFSVFPNPNSGLIKIRYTLKDKIVTVLLSVMKGRLLKQFSFEDSSVAVKIELNNYDEETYLLSILKENGIVEYKKVVVIKQ